MAEINYTVSSSPGLDWLILRIELPAGSQLYIQPGLSPRHATALMMMHEPKRASSSKKNTHKCTQPMHAGESRETRAGEQEGEMDPGSSRKSIVKINKWIPSSVLRASNDSISFFAPLLFHSAPLWVSNAAHTPRDGSAEGLTGLRASVCRESERRLLDGLIDAKLYRVWREWCSRTRSEKSSPVLQESLSRYFLFFCVILF